MGWVVTLAALSLADIRAALIPYADQFGDAVVTGHDGFGDFVPTHGIGWVGAFADIVRNVFGAFDAFIDFRCCRLYAC